jgi:TPP-dependent pyruvate/acetoin dehydrogenase alpha subunit
VVFSNHRCHGHFLAAGGDPRALFAELMGKSTGVCGGRGGSQHLHYRNFYSNGVQGGIVPVATGMALAEKRKGSGVVVVCFLGDGTMGEGVIYEAFNMASLWQAPMLYIVENNAIAQTTPVELALAGDIPTRFQAFGISARELDTSDVREIYPVAEGMLAEVRSSNTPRGLILRTARFGPHSKGDDTRPQEAIARLRAERDPVMIHGSRLSAELRSSIELEINKQIQKAYQQALHDPAPSDV